MESSGAPVVMCYSERLADGAGYALHFTPLEVDASRSIPQQVNMALEAVIRSLPEQYLWSYNRYKVPRGVQPPNVLKER
jgi:KDO2-lipid IV(A) lauroyltransferase